jgi:hypothetical protein
MSQTNVTWNPDSHTVFGPNWNLPKTIDDWVNPTERSWGPSKYPPRPPNTPVIPTETANKIQDQLSNVPLKADAGKTDWSLMPFEAIEEINKVLEFGAKKYAAHNWKKGSGFKYTRLLGSLLRHIFAYMRGEDKDPESGLSHMAHAGCNVIFLLYYDKYRDKFTNDDRGV